eukprot:jgi/Mesvir1/10342/Mv10543-RA.1
MPVRKPASAPSKKPRAAKAARTRTRKSHVARAGEVEGASDEEVNADREEPGLSITAAVAKEKTLKREANKAFRAETDGPPLSDEQLAIMDKKILKAMEKAEKEADRWDQTMKNVPKKRRSIRAVHVKLEEPAETFYNPATGRNELPNKWVEFNELNGIDLKNKMSGWSKEETARRFREFSEKVDRGEIDLNELVRARGANWNRQVGPGMTKATQQVRPPLAV